MQSVIDSFSKKRNLWSVAYLFVFMVPLIYISLFKSSPIINQVPLWVLEDRILKWNGKSAFLGSDFMFGIWQYICMTLDTPFRCVLFNLNYELGPFQTERILFPGVVYILYNPISATFLFLKFQILYSLAGCVIRHGSFSSKRT